MVDMRCLSTALILLTSAACRADVVILSDRDEPVYGTVREEKDRIVVRAQTDDGTIRDQTFRREQVEEIIRAVSPERLAALDPARPEGFYEYAEELWGRRRDLQARHMAIRLYVVAAWLDRERLGPPALRALITLARSAEEAQKFRGALYLLDPQATLDDVQPAAGGGGAEKGAAQELLRALRLLRTGRGTTARAIVEKPEVAELLQRYSRILSRAELNAASGQATLSPRELRQSLLLELEMEAIVHPTPAGQRAASLAWSRELQGAGAKAVPSFALESLTEFDPRKCVFREGKWVEP